MACGSLPFSSVLARPVVKWSAAWTGIGRTLLVLLFLFCVAPPASASKFSHWMDVHVNPTRGPNEAIGKTKEAADAATKTFAEADRVLLLVKWPLFIVAVSLALWIIPNAISSWRRFLAGLRSTETPLTPRAVRWGIAAWLPFTIGIALPIPAFAERDAALRGLIGLGMLFALRGVYLCVRPHASKAAQSVAIVLNVGYIILMVI